MRKFLQEAIRSAEGEAFLSGADTFRDLATAAQDFERVAYERYPDEGVRVSDDLVQAVRALQELTFQSVPDSFRKQYFYSPGDELAPFISESFLYALIGKEDARTLLSYFRSFTESLGVEKDEWMSRLTFHGDEILEIEKILAPVMRVAFIKGLQWGLEFEPDEKGGRDAYYAYHNRAHEALREIYPGGDKVFSPATTPYKAFIKMMTFVPELAARDNQPERAFFSTDFLNSTLGVEGTQIVREHLRAIATLVWADMDKIEHAQQLKQDKDYEYLVLMRERQEKLSVHKKTGSTFLDGVPPKLKEDLRLQYPLVGTVNSEGSRKYGTPEGTTFPYVRQDDEITYEVLYEIETTGEGKLKKRYASRWRTGSLDIESGNV